MLSRFFDMDNPIWRGMGKITDLILLTLLFYLCCVPVITIIPACCALFDTISRCVKSDAPGCYSRFFKTFLQELKRGIPLTLFWLLVGAIVLCGDQILQYHAQLNTAIQIHAVLYRILFLALLALLGWLIPLQSRYHFSFINLHRNALYFFIARLPGTIWMLISTALIVVACLIHPYTLILLTIAPALISLIHAHTVEKAFQVIFPDDYVEGQLVTTPEEREAAIKIASDKKKSL